MKKIFAAIAALFAFVNIATAQTLPAGSLGSVTSNTPNTWQTFNYTFTPSTTGANFLGFAFRQDPAFWTFDNVRLTASGSSTNLLTNGAFDTGGQFSVTTNNGPSSMQAPTNWGVWYQNGTYPAAAGTWTNVGGTHGGVWYDGAVGSFDGIYQGVALTAGTTYTIAFEVSGNNTSNGSSIQLGVYGGACATVSIAPDQCTIPSTVGFTTLATPSQGAAAGNPTPPPVTLVSTTNLAATATSSTTYGNASVTNQVVDSRVNSGGWIRVNRATTPVTARPFTTTVVTTPHTLETYSDNSTVTTNGTAVTTSSNGVQLTTGQTTTQTASASAAGSKEAIAARNMNLFIVDPLSTRDGVWGNPFYRYTSVTGNYGAKGISTGWQKTVEKNTFGFGFSYDYGDSNNYLNSKTDTENYSGNVYLLNKQTYLWYKASIGYGKSDYSTAVGIPSFALLNNSKITQKNYYADLGLYSGSAFYKVRPLVGVIVNRSDLTGAEGGSSLLSTLPPNVATTKTMPYIGARYEFTDGISLETRFVNTPDYNMVSYNRGTINKDLTEKISVGLTLGVDKGLDKGYTNYTGSLGMKVKF
jgi:hypothetical protein